MKYPYHILELANVHGGDFNYLLDLVKTYSNYSGAYGIKFQPFKYDEIALENYKWYPVYQELFFDEKQWEEVINKASETKDIWIDVFDNYSFQIVKNNLKKVHGLKFQASVLANKTLLNSFKTLDLSDKKVILNISGYSLDQIVSLEKEFRTALNPNEIILQIGFQSYPTVLKDSGLMKIQAVRERFSNKLSFADHIEAGLDDAAILPVFAYLNGVEYIEKHIRLKDPQPKYDFYSALDPEQFARYIEMLNRYAETTDQPFVNANESKYLSGTLQIPVLKQDVRAGKIISPDNDLVYKRTNSPGLNQEELQRLTQEFYVLSRDKKAGDVLYKEDFRKASIASIIACRLKSSRLPKKALKEIGALPSVEYCIKSALGFHNVNHTVLATSDVEEDAELENHTYNKEVIFFQGHPLDVMKRFVDAIDKYKFDVIVRITADMPFVSDEVLEILLRSHFETGADYTRAKEAAVGTNLEIMNAEALRRMKSYFPNADYSEYMTYYFINNPDRFRVNEIDLPSELVRDYRLTLDYPEDLEMFNKIEKHLQDNQLKQTLKNIFAYLDANPEVAAINGNLGLIYKTSQDLIDKLNQYTRIEANA